MNYYFDSVRLALIALIVNIGSVLAGMMLSWPSPILPKLSSNTTLVQNPLGRLITSTEQSWMGSLQSLGGIVGPTITGVIMDKMGRKWALALLHVPNLCGTILAAVGKNIWCYYLARFLAGMSLNSTINMNAMYFTEVGTKFNRGFLCSTTNVCMAVGSLLTYCIGPYTSIMAFNIMLFAITLCGVIGVVLVVPESPFYYVRQNNTCKAAEVLTLIRGCHDVQGELKQITDNVAHMRNDGVTVLLTNVASRRAFLISLVIVGFVQLTGISAMFAYTQLIFERSGSNLSDEVSSIIVGLAQLVSVSIGLTLIEKMDRKTMMYSGSSGVAVTFAVLGTFFLYHDRNSELTDKINWVPLVCLTLFFMLYNGFLSATPFLVMGEILPMNVKFIGGSITMACFSFLGFIFSYFFNDITEAFGNAGPFYFFSGSMVVCILFVALCMFETRGKTLQEIADRLGSK